MARKKMRPVALAGADRTPESQVLPTLHPEFTISPLTAQAHFIARRFGVAPALAPIVAALAFPPREASR